MDWSQIVGMLDKIASVLNQLAPVVLAGFTVVLAIATVKLHRSTKHYSNATKEVAQSTERYAEISEKLLEMEQLNFVNGVFRHIYSHDQNLRPVNVEYNKALVSIGKKRGWIQEGHSTTDKGDVEKKLNELHTALMGKLLARLSEEALQDASSKAPPESTGAPHDDTGSEGGTI